MHALRELLNLVWQGSLMPSSSVLGIWYFSGYIRYMYMWANDWTYPPPTNNICHRFSPSLEVLLKLVMRAPCGIVLPLDSLDSVEKKGTTILK
jgi:hypothetical protein